MPRQLILRVNGRKQTVTAGRDTPLLYVLRNDLGLNGPKFGCGLGQCGACSVLKDGEPIRSCITPVSSAAGSEIVTSEGLAARGELHPVQAALIEEQAIQCGYCMSGMVIGAVALLKRNPKPSKDEIKAGMDAYLCRCGTHLRIVRAIERASKMGV